jgi:hypothetical protein
VSVLQNQPERMTLRLIITEIKSLKLSALLMSATLHFFAGKDKRLRNFCKDVAKVRRQPAGLTYPYLKPCAPGAKVCFATGSFKYIHNR